MTEPMPIPCPSCGSTDTARILWGMPAGNEQVERERERGPVILGGCLVPAGVWPTHACRTCGHVWVDEDED